MSRGSSCERPVVSITREQAVRVAIRNNSLQELQQLSLLPGGFGKARSQAWPYLLGVLSSKDIDASVSDKEESVCRTGLSNSWTECSSASTGSENASRCFPEPSLDGISSHSLSGATDISHPDEHQVQLDTDRSFILYPVAGSAVNHRKHLQEDLHDIILGVLRKRPALRYFQGYHDIVTVLFLSLPPKLVLPSAEKLSLHRLRDSMGNGLEPLVGQLRILKRLLRMIDQPYAEVLERSSPLPYYALSNLLTLFAHDVPTLPLIQHVFDWLLSREPIACIWLAAAVILSRKADVLILEREGDEAMGMIHAVLSAMPPLSEDDLSSPSHSSSTDAIQTSADEGGSEDSLDALHTLDEQHPTDISGHEALGGELIRSSDSLSNSWAMNSPPTTSFPATISIGNSKAGMESAEVDDIISDVAGGSDIEMSEETRSLPPSQSQSHSRSVPQFLHDKFNENPHSSPLSLSALLCHASDLFAAYPPSSPTLRLKETFGVQSVLYPNGQTMPDIFARLPDDVAESFVGGDNVVLPLSQEEEEEESAPTRRPRNRESDSEKMRRGLPIRIANGMVRRQTVVAGVVLLLGVAVALYGFSPGGKCVRSGSAKMGSGNVKYIVAWVGGLLGVGERLGIGL
ncbi:rab-GTPase-TBC domain-containing protein [Gautieria morchelliformis]|nr:rab-GTPase-TBC domain-containing protein [Gautieria morchelliformis]